MATLGSPGGVANGTVLASVDEFITEATGGVSMTQGRQQSVQCEQEAQLFPRATCLCYAHCKLISLSRFV